MRRPGLWVANGHPGNPAQMLSWRPGALTCFFDYLGVNGVFGYKAANPDVPVIVRFQHPFNWQQDPVGFARRLGEQVASKWNDLKVLDPYVYFANEMNLHYENGDQNPGNQSNYTTPEFYQKYAQWVRMTADTIKSRVPEMKLVTPPFAFGHHEDGSPDDNASRAKVGPATITFTKLLAITLITLSAFMPTGAMPAAPSPPGCTTRCSHRGTPFAGGGY